MPAPQASIQLANGWVRHRRYLPKAHHFSYKVGYIQIDASAIDNLALAAGSPLPINRWGLIAINRADLIEPIDSSIEAAVNTHLATAGLQVPAGGRISILTLPRFMGYTFNPVSFYTVYNAQQQVLAVLSDITNTPWGERHVYVHVANTLNALDKSGLAHQFTLAKNFHVSPFMPMNLAYDWRFKWGNGQQVIHMRLLEGPQPASAANGESLSKKPNQNTPPHTGANVTKPAKLVFDATFSFVSSPLTRVSIWRLSLQYPLLPLLVVFRIYWHALLLYLKGVPFYPHPHRQRDAPH